MVVVAPAAPPHQEGVLTTAQASGLYTPAYVRAQLAARRWQRPARGVVVTHNGPLTECQAAWVALLRCPHGTALAALTALGFDGVNGFPEPKPHVVLPAGADRPSGVVPHWSTEFPLSTCIRFVSRAVPDRRAAPWTRPAGRPTNAVHAQSCCRGSTTDRPAGRPVGRVEPTRTVPASRADQGVDTRCGRRRAVTA